MKPVQLITIILLSVLLVMVQSYPFREERKGPEFTQKQSVQDVKRDNVRSQLYEDTINLSVNLNGLRGYGYKGGNGIINDSSDDTEKENSDTNKELDSKNAKNTKTTNNENANIGKLTNSNTDESNDGNAKNHEKDNIGNNANQNESGNKSGNGKGSTSTNNNGSQTNNRNKQKNNNNSFNNNNENNNNGNKNSGTIADNKNDTNKTKDDDNENDDGVDGKTIGIGRKRRLVSNNREIREQLFEDTIDLSVNLGGRRGDNNKNQSNVNDNSKDIRSKDQSTVFKRLQTAGKTTRGQLFEDMVELDVNLGGKKGNGISNDKTTNNDDDNTSNIEKDSRKTRLVNERQRGREQLFEDTIHLAVNLGGKKGGKNNTIVNYNDDTDNENQKSEKRRSIKSGENKKEQLFEDTVNLSVNLGGKKEGQKLVDNIDNFSNNDNIANKRDSNTVSRRRRLDKSREQLFEDTVHLSVNIGGKKGDKGTENETDLKTNQTKNKERNKRTETGQK